MPRSIKINNKIKFLHRGGLTPEEIASRLSLHLEFVKDVLEIKPANSSERPVKKQCWGKTAKEMLKAYKMYEEGKSLSEIEISLKISRTTIVKYIPELQKKVKGPPAEKNAQRNAEILKKYQGGTSAFDLAAEYKLTVPYIYKLTSDLKKALTQKTVPQSLETEGSTA